jgi:hypothetical protein
MRDKIHEVEEELPEVQSQEQAAESRAGRLAGRAEGRRVAAEKAEAAVGARSAATYTPRRSWAWWRSGGCAPRAGR